MLDLQEEEPDDGESATYSTFGLTLLRAGTCNILPTSPRMDEAAKEEAERKACIRHFVTDALTGLHAGA